MNANLSQASNPATQRPLRAFLCHSFNDKPAVRDLYQRLKAEKGIDPWLEDEKLLPGQNWDLEIRKAIEKTDVVIICLTPGSITKVGYINKEIKKALDVADEQTEGTIFLIPLKLEECEIPHQLRGPQWVSLFEPQGYERLILALRARAHALGIA